MITLTREEAQQVLECMETAIKAGDWVVDGACDPDFILYMLRTRLAQPEPSVEPYGYLWFTRYMEQRFTHRNPDERERIGDVIPVYTAPLQREWQGLTDEEIKKEQHHIDWTSAHTYAKFARAIEAKLKEKNNG